MSDLQSPDQLTGQLGNMTTEDEQIPFKIHDAESALSQVSKSLDLSAECCEPKKLTVPCDTEQTQQDSQQHLQVPPSTTKNQGSSSPSDTKLSEQKEDEKIQRQITLGSIPKSQDSYKFQLVPKKIESAGGAQDLPPNGNRHRESMKSLTYVSPEKKKMDENSCNSPNKNKLQQLKTPNRNEPFSSSSRFKKWNPTYNQQMKESPTTLPMKKSPTTSPMKVNHSYNNLNQSWNRYPPRRPEPASDKKHHLNATSPRKHSRQNMIQPSSGSKGLLKNSNNNISQLTFDSQVLAIEKQITRKQEISDFDHNQSCGFSDDDEDSNATKSAMGKSIFDNNSNQNDNVKVCIRIRPFNEREKSNPQGLIKCIKVKQSTVIIDRFKQFNFDFVGDEQIEQATMFNHVAKPIADCCLQGYNGTIFAYGQTGAGKTYTIQGPTLEIEDSPREDSGENTTVSPDGEAATPAASQKGSKEDEGIIQRSFEYIFSNIQAQQKLMKDTSTGGDLSYIIKCSYLEIYQEQIIDLLEPTSKNLNIREDIKTGIYIAGLQQEVINSPRDIFELIKRGMNNRHIGATMMNSESSRSHSVLTAMIEQKSVSSSGVQIIKNSRFNIIDLAGSERSKQTQAIGERLKEAGMINKSLSALGNVINCLVEHSKGKVSYIPYRDSKLTFILRDSLGGNSKTVIIANISPSLCNMSETLSTLEFAKRAKQIKNKATINEDSQGTILILKNEIKRLKKDIAEQLKENLKLQEKQQTNDSSLKLQRQSTFEGQNSKRVVTLFMCKKCKANLDEDEYKQAQEGGSNADQTILSGGGGAGEVSPFEGNAAAQDILSVEAFDDFGPRAKEAERLLAINLENLTRQQKHFESEMKQLREEYQAQTEAFEALTQQNNREKMKMKMREDKIAKLETKYCVQMSEECVNLQNELKLLQQQLDQERQEKTNPQITALKAQLVKAQQQLKQPKDADVSKHEELQSLFNEQTRFIDELNDYLKTKVGIEALEQHEEQLKLLNKEIEDEKESKLSLKEQLDDLQQYYDTLLAQNVQVEAVNQQVTRQYGKAQTDIKDLEERLESQKNKFKKAVQSHTEEKNQFNNQIFLLQQAVTEAEGKIADQVQSMKQSEVEFDQKFAAINIELLGSRNETEQLKIKLEEKIQVIHSMDKDILQKDINLQEKTEQFINLQKIQDALTKQTSKNIETLSEQLTKSTDQLNKKGQALKKKDELLSQLSDRMNDSLKEKTMEFEKLNNEFKDISQAKQNADSQLVKIQENLKQVIDEKLLLKQEHEKTIKAKDQVNSQLLKVEESLKEVSDEKQVLKQEHEKAVQAKDQVDSILSKVQESLKKIQDEKKMLVQEHEKTVLAKFQLDKDCNHLKKEIEILKSKHKAETEAHIDEQKKLTNEREQFKTNMCDLSKSNEEKDTQNKAIISDLNAQLEQLNIQKDSLSTELKLTKESNKNIQRNLDEVNEQIEKFQKENKTVKLDLDTVNKDKEIVQNNLDNANLQIEKMQDENKTVKLDLDNLKKDREIVQSNLDQANEEIEKLQKENKTVSHNLDTVMKDKELVDKKYDDLKQKEQTLLSKHQQDRDAHMNQQLELTKQVSDAFKQINSLTKSSEEKALSQKTIIEKLNNQLHVQVEKNEKLTAESQDIRNKLQSASIQLQRANTDYKSLMDDNQALVKDKDNLTKEKEELQEECGGLKKAHETILKQRKCDSDTHKSLHEGLEKQVNEQNEQICDLKHQVELKDTQNKNLNNYLFQKTNQVNLLTSEVTGLKDKNITFEKDLATTRQELDDLEQVKDKLKQDNDTLKKEKEIMQKEYQNFNRQHESLISAHQSEIQTHKSEIQKQLDIKEDLLDQLKKTKEILAKAREGESEASQVKDQLLKDIHDKEASNKKQCDKLQKEVQEQIKLNELLFSEINDLKKINIQKQDELEVALEKSKEMPYLQKTCNELKQERDRLVSRQELEAKDHIEAQEELKKELSRVENSILDKEAEIQSQKEQFEQQMKEKYNEMYYMMKETEDNSEEKFNKYKQSFDDEMMKFKQETKTVIFEQINKIDSLQQKNSSSEKEIKDLDDYKNKLLSQVELSKEQIKDLEAQLSEKEQQIKSLLIVEQEKHQLTRECNELKKVRDALLNEQKKLNQEIEQVKTQINELKKSSEAKETQNMATIKDLNEKLKANTKQKEEVSQELNEVIQQKQNIQIELDNAQQQIGQLKNDKQIQIQDHNCLQKHKDQLHKEYNDLKEERDTLETQYQSETQNYHQRLQELNKLVSELKSQIGDLNISHSQQQKESKTKIDDLNQELQKKTKQSDDFSSELKDVKLSKQSILSDLEKKNQEYDQLQQEKDTLTSNLENLKQEKQNLETNLCDYKTKCDTLHNKHQCDSESHQKREIEFSNKVNEANDEIRKLRQLIQEKESNIKSLDDQLQEKSKQITELTKSKQVLYQKVQGLELELNEANEQINKFRKTLEEKEANIKQLDNQLQEKAQQITELTKTSQDQTQKIQGLEKELKEANEEINKLRKLLEEKEVNIKTLNDQLQEKTNQIAELSKQKDDLTQQNQDVLNQLSESKQQHQVTSTEKQALQTSNQSLLQDKSDLSNKLCQLQSTHDSLLVSHKSDSEAHQKREQQLSSQVSDSKAKIDNLSSALAEKQALIDKATQEIKEKTGLNVELTQKVEGMQENLESRQKEVVEGKQKIVEQQNQLESLTKQKKELQEIYNALKEELETLKAQSQSESMHNAQKLDELQRQLAFIKEQKTSAIEQKLQAVRQYEEREEQVKDLEEKLLGKENFMKKQLQLVIDEKDDEIQGLNSKIKQNEKKTKDLKEQKQKLSEQITAQMNEQNLNRIQFESQLCKMKQEIADQKYKIGSFDAERNRFEQEASRLNKLNVDIWNKQEELIKQSKLDQDKIKELKTSLSNLKKTQKKTESKQDRLIQEKTKIESKLRQHNEVLRERSDTIREQELQKAQLMFSKMNSESKFQGKIDNLKQETTFKNNCLIETQKACGKLSREKDELEANFEKLKEEKLVLAQKFAKLTQDKKELVKNYNKLNQEKEEIANNLDKITIENEEIYQSLNQKQENEVVLISRINDLLTQVEGISLDKSNITVATTQMVGNKEFDLIQKECNKHINLIEQKQEAYTQSLTDSEDIDQQIKKAKATVSETLSQIQQYAQDNYENNQSSEIQLQIDNLVAKIAHGFSKIYDTQINLEQKKAIVKEQQIKNKMQSLQEEEKKNCKFIIALNQMKEAETNELRGDIENLKHEFESFIGFWMLDQLFQDQNLSKDEELMNQEISEQDPTNQVSSTLLDVAQCSLIVMNKEIENVTWGNMNKVATNQKAFHSFMKNYSYKDLTEKQVEQLKKIVSKPELTLENIQKKSIQASEILKWIKGLLKQYEQKQNGSRPPRSPNYVRTSTEFNEQLKKADQIHSQSHNDLDSIFNMSKSTATKDTNRKSVSRPRMKPIIQSIDMTMIPEIAYGDKGKLVTQPPSARKQTMVSPKPITDVLTQSRFNSGRNSIKSMASFTSISSQKQKKVVPPGDDGLNFQQLYFAKQMSKIRREGQKNNEIKYETVKKVNNNIVSKDSARQKDNTFQRLHRQGTTKVKNSKN